MVSEPMGSSSQMDVRTAAQIALGPALAGGSVGTVLERVAALAKDTLPDVDEASVTLIKNGKPRTLAFTGPLAIHLDERQYDKGFGPCLDAAVSGSLIVIADTAAETTYKDFAEIAMRQGVTHSLSIGMLVGTSTVGGINLYGRNGRSFDEAAIEAVGSFAGYAAIALANAAAMADAVEEVAGMRAAMATRAVIEQAKGILMRDHGCDPDQAFKMLVQASNESNRKLRDIAIALVEDAQR